MNFWIKKLHSLAGLALVLFVCEHLLTNSLSALFLQDLGAGFIRMVGYLHDAPYLHAIELSLIAAPLALHAFLGIKSIYSSRPNSLPYLRNRTYTWQRITSWILLVAILLHVVHMRFLHYPDEQEGGYVVRIEAFDDMQKLAKKWHVQVEPDKQAFLLTAPSFGIASLFVVRSLLQTVEMQILYALFVIATAFHASNGLWSLAITCGLTVTVASQKMMQIFSWILMALLTLFGLFAIFGGYHG